MTLYLLYPNLDCASQFGEVYSWFMSIEVLRSHTASYLDNQFTCVYRYTIRIIVLVIYHLIKLISLVSRDIASLTQAALGS